MSRIEKALERAIKLRTGELEPKEDSLSHQKARHNKADNAFSSKITIKKDNQDLVTFSSPDSPITEEFRKLKSIIIKLTKKGKFYNAIMMTSAIGGEGKSLTALNFAITLAQEFDHTVLLIDADLRRPSIHRYLDFQPEVGLADCLKDDIELSAALIKTNIGRLVILPAGSKVDNPVELIMSNKMKDLVKDLKQRYADRYIIIDTPPVLPFAEAHSIASLVDGVLFVVREGYASIDNIKAALNMLKDANIIGTIYNDVEISKLDMNYSYYYNRETK